MSILERLKAGEDIRSILASAEGIEGDVIVALFQEAVSSEDLNLLNSIFEVATPAQRRAMIRANNFGAFIYAASNGRLGVARFLLGRAVETDLTLRERMTGFDIRERMIRANGFEAFRDAA